MAQNSSGTVASVLETSESYGYIPKEAWPIEGGLGVLQAWRALRSKEQATLLVVLLSVGEDRYSLPVWSQKSTNGFPSMRGGEGEAN